MSTGAAAGLAWYSWRCHSNGFRALSPSGTSKVARLATAVCKQGRGRCSPSRPPRGPRVAVSQAPALPNITHFLSFTGFVDSIHHSSHSAPLSSKPSATSAPQGGQAEPSSHPSSLPAPQKPPQEASQAHPGMNRHWAGLVSSPPSRLFDHALQGQMFPLLGAHMHQIFNSVERPS